MLSEYTYDVLALSSLPKAHVQCLCDNNGISAKSMAQEMFLHQHTSLSLFVMSDWFSPNMD